jgi:hypothetical protein
MTKDNHWTIRITDELREKIENTQIILESETGFQYTRNQILEYLLAKGCECLEEHGIT